ncbi:MAG: 1-deoxy-D-xylulose-5-phosphate reductoisomerase [Deltaproteobacteria bacterium]|nr:1-deoxy-D-xylulose-5-phosphate reductoisomerase [Candidatus Anaeroferrophillus wilburensis]MBN2889330.1 1-deoxy-D-xylulose-5-phosphate reductoisomerase [Deltaproteobacteria bacterium]
MKKLVVLGSTGSIGTNTLDLVRRFPQRFSVAGLAAGRNLDILVEQVQMVRPEIVSVATAELADQLGRRLQIISYAPEIVWGDAGLVQVATLPAADLVVSAMVGAIGLRPTYEALLAGKDVALANKESMVMAGRLLNETARRQGARILPLDSEHSAIWQSLQGEQRESLRKLTLTASGGPFYQMPKEELVHVSPEQAVKHPRWQMGPKISIDSATLMNKALEIIEARWLFEEEPEKIEAIIHPQSIVHSLVEFCDGSVIAHLALPDMRLPIAYALNYPRRLELDLPVLNLARERRLDFYPVDGDRFPALRLAHQALALGDSGTAALNAANEVAVARFIEGQLNFLEITEVVESVLSSVAHQNFSTVDQVLDFDRQVRISMTP